MSSFTNELKASPLSNGIDWKLLASFSYHVGSKYSKTVVKVPAGFVTDFASIPAFIVVMFGLIAMVIGYYWAAWLFILGIIAAICAAIMPRWGKYGKAAVIHDYLYYTKDFSRRIADSIFLEAMEVLGVNLIERKTMYYAVRWFGWLAWKKRK